MNVERVIILGIDGIGNSPKTVNTQNFDRIVNNGLYSYAGRTEFPPISGECWGTILHGVAPCMHQLTNDIAFYVKWPDESQYPSIFKYVRNKFPDATLASFSSWNAINTGMIEQNIGVHFETDSDENIINSLARYLEGNDPKLLFLDLDDCDHAGHEFGFFTDQYFNQVEKSDKQIGLILDVIEKRKWFKDSLIMIVTDHGGGGVVLKDHLYDHPQDMTVFFACCGPQVPHFELKQFNNADIPAIVLSALGIKKPDLWHGRTINDMK